MKITFTPSLASLILLAISVLDNGAQAAPLEASKRESGVIHLPLAPQHDLSRRDVHPQLMFQQHYNRAVRRYARMTQREEPSTEHLKSLLSRRAENVDGALTKRMYIKEGSSRTPLYKGKATAGVKENVEELAAAKKHKHHKHKATAAGAGAGAVAAGAAGAVAEGAGKDAGADPADDGTAETGATPDDGADANGETADDGSNEDQSGAGTDENADAGSGAGFNPEDLQAAESDSVAESDVKDGNDTTGLNIEANDVAYFSTIQIGTPPKDYKVIMDSGSADLFVQATNCEVSGVNQKVACSDKHQTLGTDTSSTFKDSGKQWQTTFGSGNAAGNIVQDDVVLAGLKLPNHVFGDSRLESNDFAADNVPVDGLMGLAQSTLSQQQTLTPVESLAKAGTIKSAITSFKLSRLSDGKNDGQVTFGGLDSTKFDPATLVTVPNVSQTGFWEGAVDKFTVDGQDVGLAGRTAILDTGTTLIIAPPADAAAIHKVIPGAKSDGQGGFTVPCNLNSSVALEFGGKSFAIDPSDITFLPVDQNDLNGDCQSGISAGQIGGAKEWLVGDVFLKNAYFSTDVGKNTVSLAELV